MEQNLPLAPECQPERDTHQTRFQWLEISTGHTQPGGSWKGNLLCAQDKKAQKQVMMNISHIFEPGQTLGDGDGQGSRHAAVQRVAKSWTWQLNNNSTIFIC